MNVLVEFIGVGDAGCKEGFDSADEDIEGDRVDLGDDIIRNTIGLGTPASRYLPSDQTIEFECFRDQ